MKFTAEQEAIINHAMSPQEVPRAGTLHSGAGTGKTTVQEGLAKRSRMLGHQNITNLTFNRSAAADAQSRLRVSASCKTLLSVAFQVEYTHTYAYPHTQSSHSLVHSHHPPTHPTHPTKVALGLAPSPIPRHGSCSDLSKTL